jgi:hypothetical protein
VWPAKKNEKRKKKRSAAERVSILRQERKRQEGRRNAVHV